MKINIVKQPDISLDELVGRQAQGFSVLRSAHVGNARLYNQVLASVGIDILLVDQNVTGVDKNYVPEAIVQDGGTTLVAPLGQLTMRATTFTGDQYLDELHAGSLRAAFPNTAVITDNEYLRNNESIVAEIVRLGAQAMPEIFRRSVRKDEKESNTDNSDTRSIERSGILQLSDDPRKDAGILCPNEINIFSNFVIEALKSGRDEQFHISGPDMIVYIKNIVPVLQRLGGLIDSSFLSKSLPETITVQLVPGTSLSIAGTRAHASDVASFANAAEALIETKRSNTETRRSFFKDGTNRPKDEVNAFTSRLRAAEKELEHEASALYAQCPDVFCGPRDNPFVSQYDTIKDGGLFVPDITRRLTMNELAELKKTLTAGTGVKT